MKLYIYILRLPANIGLTPTLSLSFLTFLFLLLGLFSIVVSQSLFAQQKKHVSSLLEMRQDKVVMQKWDLSCGAATLTTLLKYQHGINTDEKTVAKGLINRKEYIDDPDLLRYREGFSLLDLQRYTKKIGLQGKGYGNLSFDDLLTLTPVLLPINLNGYNHFVIFRGKLNNRVLLADPAWGNRTLFIDDFKKAWISFPKFGRVGFTVNNPKITKQAQTAKNQLAVTALDFTVTH